MRYRSTDNELVDLLLARARDVLTPDGEEEAFRKLSEAEAMAVSPLLECPRVWRLIMGVAEGLEAGEVKVSDVVVNTSRMADE
uniref:Uncharacterized protein n=1 Tax=viral metagenome TaxID=1070528 RepID=A0A6M3LE35_9ZZZZ